MTETKDEEKMVKVKMLKHVASVKGTWSPGDIIEMPESEALELCKITKVHDGINLVNNQKAILLDEAIKLSNEKIDASKMTQKELNELGLKYTVETPKDETFEKEFAKYTKPFEDNKFWKKKKKAQEKSVEE